MSWVRYDDNFDQHPKFLALRGAGTAKALELGRRARVLHSSVLAWCGRMNSDGLVPPHAMPLIASNSLLTVPEAEEAAGLLVKVGLLHRRTKKDGSGYRVHDYLDFQPSKDTVQRKAAQLERREMMRELHEWLHKSPIGKRVKQLVVERDGITCCYCGRDNLRTDGDRKSMDRRTFDLIDPATAGSWDRSGAPLTSDEVHRVAKLWCVACGYCNSLKNKRSPDETDGLQILPGHGPHKLVTDLPRSAAIQSRFDRDPIESPGRIGSDRVGSGRAGTGGDGPERDWTGAPPPAQVLSLDGAAGVPLSET